MPWRNPLPAAWTRLGGGGRRLAEAGRASGLVPPPGTPVVQVSLRLLLVAWVVVGAVAMFWTARHALAVRRLTRGVGDTVFYGADGKPWFPLDEHRRDVPLAQMSRHLPAAVVAVEDHRFYRHPGIDALGIARAAQRNLMRSSVEGGSTLTQQLARTLFLSNDRTYMRKAKEAVLALMIEQQLTKDQILEMYLNRVYLGAGTYGAEAMSRRLFGKRAKDLSLAEAAMLAGLPQAPSSLSPWTNFEGARARGRIVLARMRAERFIDERQERAAAAATVRITPSPGGSNARSGYAKEFLRQQFRDRVGNDHPPDWKVHTTFAPAVQQGAERALVDGLRKIGARGLQGALVAIDPETGDILAMVGGRDFNASPFNRAVRSKRQPGSAFKPFVYAAALERGMSPVSVLTDLHSVTAPGRQEWTPRNVSDDSPDTATLREALLESNNQAAVALQMKVGSGAVRDLGAKTGMRDLPDVPSLALGTGLVTPLELTAAFAIFPNGGFAVTPRAIVFAEDANGSIAFENEIERKRVISEESAFQAVTMLQDVVDFGTASAVRSMGLRAPLGGKTGTTSEFKDAWFVGFSTSVVAGVWIGYDQPQPIGPDAYGARVALPIWADFIRRSALPAEEFSAPTTLEDVALCRISYLRPVDGCPVYTEYFKEGDAIPRQMCPVHRGNLKQQARRVLDDVLRGVGRRVRDIFR
jgi:penicillin-binding protein 1A